MAIGHSIQEDILLVVWVPFMCVHLPHCIVTLQVCMGHKD